MKFDIQRMTDSKQSRRRRLAALPFGQKLRLLDQMRERDLALKTAKRLPRGSHGA